MRRYLFLIERVDYSNGASYCLDLASALVSRGDEVQLATTGGGLEEQFRARGIETYLVKFNPLSYRKLLEFLEEYDPHLLHIQSLRSVPFGRRIARRLRKPYVVTVHKRPGPYAPRLNDRLLCGSIAANEVIREALVNSQGLPKSLVRVIHRGIDLSLFTPESQAPSWPEGDRLPVVGCVGRLTRAKGQHLLIEAARRVLDSGAQAHFAIVGEGEEELALRKLVRKLGLEHHVTFSPHIAVKGRLYGVFDIVAMPVLKSGVGVTAIEAMAMGKPLVTSGVGEMLYQVQHGVTGLLVPEGDAEALAAAIAELLKDPARARALGEEARRWVEKSFALEPMASATVEFYEESLRGRREAAVTEVP